MPAESRQPILFSFPFAKIRLSIRTIVVGVVLLTALLTAVVAIGLQYYFGQSMAIDSALARYQLAAQNTSEHIESIDKRATHAARLLAASPNLITDVPQSTAMQQIFAEVMRSNNMLYSIYVGFPNGNFYEVVNLENSKGVRQSIKAAAEDRWVVNRVSVVDGKRIRQLDYFDDGFALRDTRIEASNYDPRLRSWFRTASVNEVKKSSPYLFQYLQIPGQTYSIQIPDSYSNSNAVLGIDITLQSFSEYLQQQQLSVAGDMFVYCPTGEILASSMTSNDDALPDVTALTLTQSQRDYLAQLGTLKVANEIDWPPIDFAVAGKPEGYSVDVIRVVAKMLGLEIEFINGFSWPEMEDKFASGNLHILQPVTRHSRVANAGIMSDPIINLPYALAIKSGAEKITRLDQLQDKVLAIPTGWALSRILKSEYPDINILDVDSSRAALDAVQSGVAYGTLDSAIILRYTAAQYFFDEIELIENIVPSSSELPTDYHLLVNTELSELSELINLAIAEITPVQRQRLQQKWLSSDGASNANYFPIVPYKTLIDTARSSDKTEKLQLFSLAGVEYLSFITPLVHGTGVLDYFAVVIPVNSVVQESMERVYISIMVTGVCLLLLLPLSWFVANPVVRPINHLFEKSISVKERQYQNVRYQPTIIKEVDELSHAMVDMASAIQTYEQGQRELMEAFIQLIAEAIDQKSPYTGGHCARVPELALMLANAAAESNSEAFKEFCFKSDDEHREFRIAAWLHDCGKITVPEHVVDKGTKLETIYNRIHEIRMRFEVLWRDAEIEYLRLAAEQPESAEQFKNIWLQKQKTLIDDFTFVAQSNVGGEFFSEEDKQRLQTIAATTWWRHFDDRLGLSPVEEQRFKKESVSLPVQEQLLADKSEHIIPRYRSTAYDPKHRINMVIPDNLYNLGEIYNLSIARGTLTAEDRFKINEHMISTIHMLEALPFPPELARVPRYASTHHETMKGTGYPRRLAGNELSIPERILAVADIFEALTAADRPYKKAKSVSVSIEIMHKMMLDEHIDRDVFELFLTSGVYLEYAQQYLDAAQIDQVDIRHYLGEKEPT